MGRGGYRGYRSAAVAGSFAQGEKPECDVRLDFVSHALGGNRTFRSFDREYLSRAVPDFGGLLFLYAAVSGFL